MAEIDPVQLSQVMSALGSSRSEKKLGAVRENIRKAHAAPMTEERRQKIREAQAARRERERLERSALGLTATAPKRDRGRPPKPVDPDAATAPKRGRGRPKKQGAQTSAELG